MTLTPEQRRMRSRIAGLTTASRHDPEEYTIQGRNAFLDSFERKVDPNNELPEAERARRAAAAFKAHMTGLALKSAQARSKK